MRIDDRFLALITVLDSPWWTSSHVLRMSRKVKDHVPIDEPPTQQRQRVNGAALDRPERARRGETSRSVQRTAMQTISLIRGRGAFCVARSKGSFPPNNQSLKSVWIYPSRNSEVLELLHDDAIRVLRLTVSVSDFSFLSPSV